jgi:hypothetical protein
MIRSFLVGSEGNKGNFCAQILKHHTLKVKLALLLYFLLCLVSMIVFIQPKKIGSLLIGTSLFLFSCFVSFRFVSFVCLFLFL